MSNIRSELFSDNNSPLLHEELGIRTMGLGKSLTLKMEKRFSEGQNGWYATFGESACRRFVACKCDLIMGRHMCEDTFQLRRVLVNFDTMKRVPVTSYGETRELHASARLLKRPAFFGLASFLVWQKPVIREWTSRVQKLSLGGVAFTALRG